MIEINGAAGGGQLLRTALSLALCTGTSFRMIGIRANRDRPGLLRQHLTAVAAAAEIGSACVSGAELGSTSLSFEPGPIKAGAYRFAIGTAGSASLVLQTILPALWSAEGESALIVEGGTHNPMAPCADFLEQTYFPSLARMGVIARFSLERHGFYPAGGGCISARVMPCPKLLPMRMIGNSGLCSISAMALISALAEDVGRRELAVVARHFRLPESAMRCVRVDAAGPGNVLIIQVHHAGHVETFTGFGQRGVSAEQVAERLSQEVREHVESKAAVSAHLADQLLLPMAMAGAGEFDTCRVTDHLATNARLIEKFLAVEIAWERASAKSWRVTIDT